MYRQYLIIAISVVTVILVVSTIPDISNLYRLLAVLNAGIATLFLFTYRDRPYSLHKMVNLFILFFFVIANAIQFSTRTNVTTFPLSVCASDSTDYERFQFLVLLLLIFFNFGYPLFRWSPQLSEDKSVSLKHKRMIMLSLFSLFCTLMYYRNAMMLMFVRGLADGGNGIETANLGGGNVGSLIFDKIVRAIPFACYLWAVHYKQPKRIQLLLLLIMLISLFPTALARNAAAMYWLPVLFYIFSFMRREKVFVLIMLFGILILFPLLDNFRYWNGDFSSISLSFDFLNEMHFDASQNFMVVLKQGIVTWGNQLIGVFLFWFPRSLWSSKPIGSGAFVAEQHSDFTNISMPFWAEGYLNFGYVGIAVFTFLLAWFCSYFDNRYWESREKSPRIKPYYLLLISSLLFILRGDLMSSVAYTLATLFDIYIVYHLIKDKNYIREISTQL